MEYEEQFLKMTLKSHFISTTKLSLRNKKPLEEWVEALTQKRGLSLNSLWYN